MSNSKLTVPLASQPEQIAAMTTRLRSAMFNSISEADVSQIMAKVVEKAKEGDAKAAQTVMDYLLGGKANISFKQVNQQIIRNPDARQQLQDEQVDRTVKQIERLEPVAERVHRSLAMVMDRAPPIEELATLAENQLEQAERWATAQAAALRQSAKGKKDIEWPDKPKFLK